MDASEWIDLVLSRASELRKAGVTGIGVEGGYFSTLAPADPEYPIAKGETATAEPDPVGALHDPSSYEGGVVPGFVIHDLETGKPRR